MSTTTATAWRELGSPGAVADALIDLYGRRGARRYDEVVTQAEHARQCGSLAFAAGSDRALVAAAFLHDIGHLLLDDRDDTGDGAIGDRHHEDVGGRFLANWFGPAVTSPIRYHVAAKRYLCAVEPAYAAGLSAASVASLVAQGGPMRPDEVTGFESLDDAATAVELRRWDDRAKTRGAAAPGLDTFRDVLVAVLSAGTEGTEGTDAATGRGADVEGAR